MLQFRQLLEPWNGAWRVLCSDDGVAVFERPVKGGPAVHKCVASFEGIALMSKHVCCVPD